MTAFYNEIEPYAAQWLRNLITAGHIAPGVVDERSIEDIAPNELHGFTQCHFFAGVGVWSLALRLAGWADERPVWTGSAPCQPFSAAGAGAGFADERHLWPAFHHLIAECRPAIVLGEQVASSHIDPWIDLVQADLEAVGYAFGGVPFPSAGVGAPHIRDRLYWVANAELQQRSGRQRAIGAEHDTCGRQQGAAAPAGLRDARGLADADAGAQRHDRSGAAGAEDGAWCGRASVEGHGDVITSGYPGPTNGYWRDADWLGCRDGKWRPVEPGTFPLAHGVAGGMGRVRADQERLAALVPRKDQGSRIGRLRAYGNAINAEAARVFVEAVMECQP